MRLAAVALLLPAAALADASAPPPDARLADAWRALHPSRALPAPCAHDDPVRVLVADVDESPGAETAFASLRFGVLLVAADGSPLASLDLGCAEPSRADPARASSLLAFDRLALDGARPLLVVRLRNVQDGRLLDERIAIRRHDRTFVEILRVDERVQHFLGSWFEPDYALARLDVRAPDLVLAEWEGRLANPTGSGCWGTARYHAHAFFRRRPGGRFERE